jgi:hypothetical protein
MVAVLERWEQEDRLLGMVAALEDTAASEDTAAVETAASGKAGAQVVMVAAEKVASVLEARAGAPVLRGPVEVLAAPVPTPRTRAQAAVSAVRAAPFAFVRPGAALAELEETREPLRLPELLQESSI